MTQTIIDFPAQDKEARRLELLTLATDLLCQALDLNQHDSFFDQEKALAADIIVLGRLVTQRLLTAHLEPQPHRVLIDDVPHTRVIEGKARVLTPFGWLRVPRWLYRPQTTPALPTVGLLEARCGIIDGATPRMAALIARFEATTTSREAVELMDLAGLCPPSRARQENKAGVIGAAVCDKLPELLGEHRAASTLPAGAVSVTVGLDRVSVPYEEPRANPTPTERVTRLRAKLPYKRPAPEPFEVIWHMDFVASVTFRDAAGQTLLTWRYGQSHTKPIEELIESVVADVAWARRQDPGLLVGICQDGARELWPPLFKALAGVDGLDVDEVFAVVDWMHLWPRAAKAIESVWGKSAQEGWKRILLNKNGGMKELERELLMLVGSDIWSGSTHEAVDELLGYIEERDGDRRDKLFDYARQRAAGMPVGSGATEATCKSLAAVRLKRSGCRWKVSGAEACMTLRALAISDGRWQSVFAHFARAYIRRVESLENGNGGAHTVIREAA